MDLWHDLAEQYREFALDARDSPCFVQWARSVAEDAELLAWLGTLPRIKQQPNLVFAAARWHGVPAPGPYAGLRDALLADAGPIRETILARGTQTNEVGRLATLVPAFAVVSDQEGGAPLSLLEIGASAGLCLYPDHYAYRWTTDDGEVTAGEGPELACRVTGPAPLPRTVPSVSHRAGVDLHPLDITDEDAMAWLETLVWPEQDDRRERLRRAVTVARQSPPDLTEGDLLERLPDLVDAAAEHGPVVVFHSAVIAYLDQDQRTGFERTIRSLVEQRRCHWVSNEGQGVLPSVTATAPDVPPDHPTFVLGLDGQALAWTHGHGATLRWVHGAEG